MKASENPADMRVTALHGRDACIHMRADLRICTENSGKF